MTLDDKLRETLERVYLRGKYEQQGLVADGTLDTDGFIAQIKKVFADEGYVDLKPSVTATGVMMSKARKGNWMTGQEWFNNFQKEIENEFVKVSNDFIQGEYLDAKNVMKAARKVSGIK